ncbi:lipocalin-like domain-containing protein [Bradyrhizobium jicamae]|uniref:lipocalin-like domain-containing protein n=1 Tax=Bradyrhizobium jicamae TaxID=280332 RepID=UPI001BA61EF0|nr:lipocalin-like domain-containing protein [Bradyrhizobium jicamae]MBR0755329.1 lipocalin-like domain-containing protein [Bradyrhizobium jicamae]
MNRFWLLSVGLALVLCSSVETFAAETLEGTYRLVAATRTIVATGEVEDSFGKNPVGYIIYGKERRMMVLIVRSDRPRLTFATMNDTQRTALFDSMAAYSGTYDFDGKTVIHHIDASWNGILTGTDAVRSVRREGNRVILSTGAIPTPTDGKISTSELVWERVDADVRP